jgi:RNA recognition motif-containing protein
MYLCSLIINNIKKMKIFVGALPHNIEERELSEQFEKFGAVASCKVITDKFTGRNKGFAFVEMENDTEANNAISGLNGMEINGKKIAVTVAEERKPREGGNRGGGGGGYNKSRNDNNRW